MMPSLYQGIDTDLENACLTIQRLMEEAGIHQEKIKQLTGQVLTSWEAEVLNIDASGMLNRFRTEYTGWLHELKASYKNDMQQLKLLYRSVGTKPEEAQVIALLQTLDEIRREKQWFVDNEERIRAQFPIYLHEEDKERLKREVQKTIDEAKKHQAEFKEKTGVKGILCNEVGSGTEILKRFGEEHIKTGYPIVYTSAESVFQIAAHEDVIPVPKLYEICEITREILNNPKYNIGTVIARPFVGTNSENFVRTYNRKDIEYPDFGRTMLDVLSENEKTVVALGKIEDLYSGRGITKAIHTQGNADGIEKTIAEIKKDTEGLIFTNLVDFDMLYGHRNNIQGYAEALEYFDGKLPEILENLKEEDILIITADHGNDPSTPSTDHSREYIPILVYGKNIKHGINLGIRSTYADISATILEMFNLDKLKYGESFYSLIK